VIGFGSTVPRTGARPSDGRRYLSDNMTEQQVKQSLQHFPCTVSLETCENPQRHERSNQIDPWANEFQNAGSSGGGFTDTGQWTDGSGGITPTGFNDTGGAFTGAA
jgi:hypothetical protein